MMDIKNNYYFKSFEGINLVYNEYWDFNLIPDKIGDYIPYTTNCKDSSNYGIITDGLVAWFDINTGATTSDGSFLKSLVQWTGSTIIPLTGFTLNDWGLTGIDNGRTDCLSGKTLIITSNDNRLVLYPVTGFTITYNFSGCTSGSSSGCTSGCTVGPGLYTYPWTFHPNTTTIEGCYVGDTICLNGGFYQGFFKLDTDRPAPKSEPYVECKKTGYTLTYTSGDTKWQVMPTDLKDGWSMETWIKWDNSFCTSGMTGSTSGTTLNDFYPNNKNFFFYIGTRAENKFWNDFSGETGIKTSKGIPLSLTETLIYDQNIVEPNSGQSWFTKSSRVGCSCDCHNSENTNYTDPDIITGGQNWFNISSRFGSNCCHICSGNSQTTVVTGMTYDYCDQLSENALGFRITEDGRIGYRKMTVTGDCYNNKYRITGTAMEEGYSEPKIIPTGNTWTHIVVTYTPGSFKNTLPAGTLKFWINGLVKYRVENFIGLQLRALNEWSDKQIGVPFNMSWGGGTQGLTESQTFNGPDYNDRNLLLQTNFAGSFEGELSQLRFYDKTLNVLEIRNNFFVDCNRYCRPDTFGGIQIVQPNYAECGTCIKPIPPIPMKPFIYYGKFSGTTLSSGDEINLTMTQANSVVNSYVTVPATTGYAYILVPASFVQPTEFRDSASGCSGFIIPVITQPSIVINTITYNVYRTFNSTSASVDIWMCS